MSRPIGIPIIAVLHFCGAGTYFYSFVSVILFGVTAGSQNSADAAAQGIDPLRSFLAGQPLEGWALLLGYGR